MDRPHHDEDDAERLEREEHSRSFKRLCDELRREKEPRPPEFSDEALALGFADEHSSDLRYVARWGSWQWWADGRWSEDATLRTFTEIRRQCRAASARCDQPKLASAIASAKTVAAIEKLARADERLAATADQWDAQTWYLNTSDGVINLQNGDLLYHDPDFHLTKMANAAAGGDCPLWMKFLDQVTAGDTELQAFLARMFGYAATGSTREHALFFCYGTGANGKSVLLNTVSGILGDYAKIAPIETFTASHGDRHPTELAGLRGARMVTAIETEEGRHWAEARIKALTGGDRIAARYMRQDFFEFTPQFKLIVAGNHKPGLRNVDEAIRRRFHLIPFTITVPPDQRDPELAEKLKAEWPGILQWIVEGCMEWQRIGLAPPKAVTEATAAYLMAEDSIMSWIDECCVQGVDYRQKSSELFASWKRWAERAGEQVGTQKRFSQQLEVRGFTPKHTKTGNYFMGLTIVPNMAGGDG